MNNNEYLCSDTESFLVFQILQKIFSWISKCKNRIKKSTNQQLHGHHSNCATVWAQRWRHDLVGEKTCANVSEWEMQRWRGDMVVTKKAWARRWHGHNSEVGATRGSCDDDVWWWAEWDDEEHYGEWNVSEWGY